jgi:hypothetical protein
MEVDGREIPFELCLPPQVSALIHFVLGGLVRARQDLTWMQGPLLVLVALEGQHCILSRQDLWAQTLWRKFDLPAVLGH